MLLRFAKIAGGLRLLITETAPLVFVSVGILSARTAAYLVGFGLGNIASAWLPIVALLVSVAGVIGYNTAECEAYRAQMRAIDNANRAVLASYSQRYQNWYNVYQSWFKNKSDYEIRERTAARQACLNADVCKDDCSGVDWANSVCGASCSMCLANADLISYPTPPPLGPTFPTLQTYPGCSSPNCPPGKKVWVQVLWASPSGNFSDSKGCFLVAYSQDAPTLPVNVEYNPFLPKEFVELRAISYYLVDGDRFRGLRDNDWKNLESVSGWDKGYWKAEHTDVECRGWRPGWSRKIK